jgi:IclR family acetate operon transcriptional repressor
VGALSGQSGQKPGRGYGRVLDVLELIARDTKGYTLSAICDLLGIPKSTGSLLLQELVEHRFIMVDSDRRYRLGPKMVQLAFQVTGHQQLTKIARSYLEQLSQLTGEDSYLAMRTGMQAIYVDKVEGSHSVRFDMRLGVPLYMHCTAVGRVILAYGESELLEQLMAVRGLRKVTANTITDPAALREELARVRAQGFSVTDGESVEGICGLAAPVQDHSGTVAGAVALSCLRQRYFQNQGYLIEHLVETVNRLRMALGGR